MEKRTTTSYASLPLALIFLVGGLLIGAAGIIRIRDILQLARYTQTTGTVRATDIYVQGRDAEFVPVVWYDYSVGGKAFIGNRIAVDAPTTHSLSEAQNVLADAKSASPLVIYFDPNAPERSVLRKSYSVGPPILFAALSALMLAGAIVAARAIFPAARRCKSVNVPCPT